MAVFRRSFRWPMENKKTMKLRIPKSESGFGFTVAWTNPPLVDYIHEGGNAEKAGLMPGDKIISLDKIKVSKKDKEEIESIVKNVKDVMELEIIRPESELATRKRQTSLRRKESFTKKGSKMIIQDCNIMLWRRERAVLKLLLCEEELLSTIHLGKERFILALRKRCNLATPMELNILFGNIEEVACTNERCVQQLRQMAQGNDDNIGRLYQKQIDDRCSVLKTYVYGLHLSNILLRYKMSNKAFKEFIKNLEKEEGAIEMTKFLEKPVQYITDLTLQLETLLSCTAVGHRDYVCLESVVSAFQNFSKEMVDAMAKLSIFVDCEGVQSPYDGDEPYVNLETLQEKTIFTKGPRNFSLVHPGRYWLFSGELSKIEGRHYIQYWALLLSDCLILTRRTEQRVLLVLDEPVMLRSIYQATFDVKKCDTEFRILFAMEKPKKSIGQRNQWLTWILRAPSVGIKLLWQTILTYQLSLYSTEALSSGSKTSFVHTRPLPGVKELASKRSTTKYEESSFVTASEKSQPVPVPAFVEQVHGKEFESIPPRVSKFILPLSKRTDLLKEITINKSKERSNFSLNENMMSLNDAISSNQSVFTRSKSFGNDFGNGIPFIDSPEEENDKEEDSHNKGDILLADKTACEDELELSDEDKRPRVSVSAPGTPQRTDKFVQTEDSSVVHARPSPKRRFPRLGTFERIKLDKRNASEPNTPTPASPSHVKTGSSFRHRRHIKTTASKEMLLKSTPVSPSKDDEKTCDEVKDSEIIQPPLVRVAERRKPRSLFSRLFKRESKGSGSDKSSGEVQMCNLVNSASSTERPPDYESAIRCSSGTSWPEQTLTEGD